MASSSTTSLSATPSSHKSDRPTLDPGSGIAEFAHDQLDGVVTDLDPAAVLELGRHAIDAVGAARRLVDGGDLSGQPNPPERSWRRRAALPRVEARLRDLEGATSVANITKPRNPVCWSSMDVSICSPARS